MSVIPHLAVPRPKFETGYWVADNDGMRSRAYMASASGEYESMLPPSIADLQFTVPSDLAAEISQAAQELAAFDKYSIMRLGADSPTLGPMSAVLLRTESASSSQIENLTVGAKQLALAGLGESTSANAQMVVANVRAMETALASEGPLDLAAILALHHELLVGQPGMEDHAGTLREQLVWVGSTPVSPRGAQHVAPEAPRVQELMEDLVCFMARDDLYAQQLTRR